MQRRDFLAGLAFTTAACAQGGPAGAPTPPVAAAPPKRDGFFAALRGLQDGTRKSPVSILQIGDSHTANDGFSGRMRELMQQRFGNAGRGVLPPGIPFRLYRADGVHVTSDGFQVVNSFPGAAPGPFGISGLRQHGNAPAQMVLKAGGPGDLASIEVEFLGRPGGGTARLICDRGPATDVPTSAKQLRPVVANIEAPEATQLTVQVTAGSIDILSWRIRRADPGVTWSNLGTIGARVSLLQRWDPAFVRAELAQENPALVVLAFGSNEGFDDTTNLSTYAAQYRAAIELLRSAVPKTSLLLIGPPDGVRHPVLGQGALCGGGRWQSPPNLARVRQAQRDIANDLGLTFWDWSAPMGGTCSMQDWAAQTPPLANPDHLHLLHAGYRLTAEALFTELMRENDLFAADAQKH
jgi:lysophospholipase L1-like esterase